MTVQVPPDSTGKVIDTKALVDGGVTVQRQKMVVTGGSGTAEVVVVTNANPGANDMGLVVRPAGTATVALAAGAANIGTINNISAAVALAAGTANIGTINNISATSIVAGTLSLGGQVSIGGSVNIFTGASIPSAVRGPVCLLVSTSTNVALVAAPGVGLAIFVTALGLSNASNINTRARVGTSASIGQVQAMLTHSGGSYVTQYVPPWKLSTNEALVGSVKPDVSEGLFNVHFYVASADIA